MRPRIKICGITREEDARLAVALGADALGFVFWEKSPRAVSREAARTIAAALPALVTRVGVFVNASPGTVVETVRQVGLDVAQLHGDEPVGPYLAAGIRLIKALAADDAGVVEVARACDPSVTVLLDAADRERRGGTGRRTNWLHAAAVAAERPIVLAGGLEAGNVAAAVADVRPWGLDVSSGVEAMPGLKDPDRLRAFFAAVDRTMEAR